MSREKLFLFLYTITTTAVICSLAAPVDTKVDSQLLHPHIITIERLETLLRRAGEIFRPVLEPVTQMQMQPNESHDPHDTLQPPTVHPYNFYLPPFEHSDESRKLDEKSRSMEKLLPPPLSNEQDRKNYYENKPKKLPKKFNSAEKLINIKWLNAFERDALADSDGNLPKAVYLAKDEASRINFDDSFFAVDMHVHTPADNNPHKDSKTSQQNNDQDFVSQSEEGEDLVAAPAAYFPQIV